MNKMLFPLALACLFCACQPSSVSSNHNNEVSQELVMLDAASHGRDEKATEALPVEEVSKNITVTASTHFPVWSDKIRVTIDSVYITNTKKFVSARTLPKILVYKLGDKEPSYWSVINLSTSFALGAERKTLLVLPVGSQKSLSSPVSKLKWAPMTSAWPSDSYYDLVPAGDYEFQLALEIYDDNDNLVDVMYTPRQKYSSVLSPSEGVVQP